jgi:tetratricopeptide (TPR) repeat protein
MAADTLNTVAKKLEPPDTHHLRAAVGWLELGNHVEAGGEIARVSPANLDHPDVLEIRWTICAGSQSWDAAAEVAESLVAIAPERSSGWVQRAYAVRRMRGGSIERAEKLLLPALDRFPKESLIPYNLACYAAQLDRLDEAWERLRKAFEIERDVKAIQARALADKDLEPLWERIRGL